jgi:hypothetical protein
MAPVLSEITNTLRSGNSVWIVGYVKVVPPNQLSPLPPPPPSLPTKWWLGPYTDYWSAQVLAHLLRHTLQGRVIEIPVNGPVSHMEDLPVLWFSGYKSDAD